MKPPRRPKVNVDLMNAVGQAVPSAHAATLKSDPQPSPSFQQPAAAVVTSSFSGHHGKSAGARTWIAGVPELHIDRLLADASTPDDGAKPTRPLTFKGNGIFGGNLSLTFFSDSRLTSISSRLRNQRINDLVLRITALINKRKKAIDPVGIATPGDCAARGSVIDRDAHTRWIRLYFERVHPFFPFLDRQSFEVTVFGPELPTLLDTHKPWSALYHAVLALGCQLDDGGSFEPGKGRSWQLYAVTLGLFPRLLTLPDSLTMLQALAAMAIYALNISCLSIEHSIVTEGARRAQNLATVAFTSGDAAQAYQRTFWVLYSIEKKTSFYFGRASGFSDTNIAVPIPSVPDALFGEFNWFLAFARHSRLLSRAMTSLFSVGVTGRPPAYYLETIDTLMAELEKWRQSIPSAIRPGEPFRPNTLPSGQLGDNAQLARHVGVWTHYLHDSLLLILCRSTLHLAATSMTEEHTSDLVPIARQNECKRVIMDMSRSMLELTSYIDVEPYTTLWIVAGIPIIGLFVLFDMVIHNPRHPRTRSNLALLDISAGHFSRLEYASGGTLPGSLIAEFAHIAREYVNEVTRSDTGIISDATTANENEPVRPASSTGAPWLALSPRVETRHSVMETSTSLVSMMSDTNNSEARGIASSIPAPMPEIVGSEVPMVFESMPPSDLDSALLDSISFPIGDQTFGSADELLIGTDVMDLFNSFVPGIDMIFQGPFQGHLS